MTVAVGFFARAGESQMELARHVPLLNAVEAHTSGMVALVPSDVDAQRLAVDGGLPAGELHLTLFFLGDASTYDLAARSAITGGIRDLLRERGCGPVVSNAFAVSMFNPAGDAPCVVLGVGDPEGSDTGLGVVRGLVAEAWARSSPVPMPAQRSPWAPHITLEYTDDAGRVEDLTDRVGAVLFDRVRVAFADEVTEIALATPVAFFRGGTRCGFWARAVTSRQRLTDLVIRNHPGHPDQKSHGRKKKLPDLTPDLNAPAAKPEPAPKPARTAPAPAKRAPRKKTAAAKPSQAEVDAARLKLERAELMHGPDRSKWSKKDRDAAEKVDKLIAAGEAEQSAPVDAARARQATIDHVRARADVLSELGEALGNESDPELAGRLVAAAAKRAGVGSDPDIAELVAAVQAGDVDGMARAQQAVEQKLGLAAVGGGRYTPSRHEPLPGDDPPRRGRPVRVVRPGYTADVDGEQVLISKAIVEEVDDRPAVVADPDVDSALTRLDERQPARPSRRRRPIDAPTTGERIPGTGTGRPAEPVAPDAGPRTRPRLRRAEERVMTAIRRLSETGSGTRTSPTADQIRTALPDIDPAVVDGILDDMRSRGLLGVSEDGRLGLTRKGRERLPGTARQTGGERFGIPESEDDAHMTPRLRRLVGARQTARTLIAEAGGDLSNLPDSIATADWQRLVDAGDLVLRPGADRFGVLRGSDFAVTEQGRTTLRPEPGDRPVARPATRQPAPVRDPYPVPSWLSGEERRRAESAGYVAGARLDARFDPSQPRDGDGKWSAFGGVPAFAKELLFADGTVNATVGRDGLQLSLTNRAGGSGKSGGLAAAERWELAQLLERAAEWDDDESGYPGEGDKPSMVARSVYTFTGGEDDPATGYAQVSHDGTGKIELELLDSEEKIRLTRAEAAQLADVVERSAGVSRVSAVSGPLDVFPTDDRKIGLRLHAADGSVKELGFDGKSWTRMRDALNVVSEGFDEMERFTKHPADPDEELPDIDSLDIATNVGPVRVSRQGSVHDPDYGTETLTVAAADGSWSFTRTAHYEDPVGEAFEAVNDYASGREWPGIENTSRIRILAAVSPARTLEADYGALTSDAPRRRSRRRRKTRSSVGGVS